jgi:hypothetical protein
VTLSLLGLWRDRESGFMITLSASMLLVLVLSWLPSPWAPLVLLLTIGLLFVLPDRRPNELSADGLSADGAPA